MPGLEEPAAGPGESSAGPEELLTGLGAEAADTGLSETPGTEAPQAEEPFSFEGLEEPTGTFGEAPAAESSASETPQAGFAEAPQGEPAAEPGFEGLELPSLEELSLEEGGGGAPAASASAPQPTGLETEPLAEEATGPGAEPALEGLSEEGLGDIGQLELSESAGSFGEAEAEPSPEPPAPAARPAAGGRPRQRARQPQPVAAGPVGGTEVQLTDAQLVTLRLNLAALPRNLKIAAQDAIAEGVGSPADQARLVRMLVAGASAAEVATLVGRITGKRIRIPEGYEKKTGVEFEEEQRSFAYAFRQNIVPILRVVLLTALVGGMFGFLAYRFVYRPLYAVSNYRSGYNQILNDRFTLGNESFTRAVNVWPVKNWFYRYAEAFALRRQYILAEQKYDQLLARYPGDHKGILDYAGLESTQLADYEKADKLLQLILNKSLYDFDALLAEGDNDIAWAETDRTRYEPARLAYATLLDRYGTRNDVLLRMLRYFIRTDNLTEVERLRTYFAARPEVKVDPAIYSELGGYLIDRRQLAWVRDVLFRASAVKPDLPELHYQLARYYRLVQKSDDEKKALDAVVEILRRSSTEPLTRRRLTIEIDTHTRLGEYQYERRQFLVTQRELQTAVSLVEQNQARGLIGKQAIFGQPYADLGDLSFYVQDDLDTAGAMYHKAVENGLSDPQVSYRIGYIEYASKDYLAAVQSFLGIEDAWGYLGSTIDNSSLLPVADTGAASPAPAAAAAPAATAAAPSAPAPAQLPDNLLFATGDAFYERGDLFAAQGYYLRLLDRLEARRAAIGNLRPAEQPDDRALLQTLAKVNNNLGVTMIRLAARTGDRTRRSQALVYLSAATEISDTLAQSPDSVQRSEPTNLPFLNMRGILYPVSNFEVQIYQALPRDLTVQIW